MALFASTILFFILSCSLWVAESQISFSILNVENGGKYGQWGTVQLCQGSHAIGFQIKEEVYGVEYDSTGLNAVALICDDGKILTSTTGPWGIWQKEQYCQKGRLVAFALKVEEDKTGDKIGASNILFLCSDNSVLIGSSTQTGNFGKLSNRCKQGSYICGIQTRVDPPQFDCDDTALNNVRLICCS